MLHATSRLVFKEVSIFMFNDTLLQTGMQSQKIRIR